ncbi:hypothetical protein ACWD4G_38800 [Streptomyces sp. NPDC002643]
MSRPPNRPEVVRKFAAAVPGPIVCKPVASPILIKDGRLKAVDTRRLTPDDLADLRGVETTAHPFQAWVDKSHEDRRSDYGSLRHHAHPWAADPDRRQTGGRRRSTTCTEVRDGDGDEVTASPFPVLDVMRAWEVWSTLTLTAPGIEHRTGTDDDGGRLAWILHADGSWARATTSPGTRTTTVHQGGPRRLYALLDEIRWRWIEHGELPVHGARVTIAPDGTTNLTRGGWTITL